jgi:ABC-type multidrug transport system permease subunit
MPRTLQSGLQILFYLIIKSSFNYIQPNSNSGPPVLVGGMSVLGMQSTAILILLLLNLADNKILQSNLKSL